MQTFAPGAHPHAAPLISTQAESVGQSALVSQDRDCGGHSTFRNERQTTLPSVLISQMHCAAVMSVHRTGTPDSHKCLVLAGQLPFGKQRPDWQTSFAVHTTPHAPQLSPVCRSLQTPPQSVWPAGQTQTPSWQLPPL